MSKLANHDPLVNIYVGDVLDGLRALPAESVQCCVTSPPYFGLRDYKMPGQIGLEPTPDAYVARMVEVFREVRRVLRADGVLLLNVGDSYTAGAGSRNGLSSSGLKTNVRDEQSRVRCCEQNKIYRSAAVGGVLKCCKPKDLIGIPWLLAFALRADGWYLRQDIIWHKPNPMPESVTDRCTKAHEYLFLLSKSERYYWDAEAIKEASSTNPVTIARNTRKDESAVGAAAMFGDAKGQSGRGGYFRQKIELVQNENGDCTIHAADVETRRTLCGRDASNTERWVWHWRGQQVDPTKLCCDKCAARLPSKNSREEIQTRNRRSVWTISTRAFRGAHFATFPPDLVQPCIAAGSSERGCCPECGSPWERAVERTSEIDESARGSTFDGGKTGARDGGDRTQAGPRFVKRPVGWRPSCDCPAHEPIPCTVLDPFSGSGTTGAVARVMGRAYVGTELNPDYAAMWGARLADVRKWWDKRQGAKPKPKRVSVKSMGESLLFNVA